MQKLILFVLIFLARFHAAAQVGHEVSGIVKDSADNAVIGATVILVSSQDSLKTVTNSDGIFILSNVTNAQFLLTVKSIGLKDFTKRYLYNDNTKRIILDPIVLNSQAFILKEVEITGSPAIIYKEDTIEYRASDYKTREHATVDELLKKMEGIEVDKDGTVTAQGSQVSRAKLNGREYSGGDVANAIQNLPADIVEKIQVIDDYGDQAARTGIKDGEAEKVLNIVTKADRSVGNIGHLNAGLGTNDRYGASVFGNRLDGNKQMNAILNFNNTVVGVAGGSNLEGMSGGKMVSNSGRGGNNSVQSNGNRNAGNGTTKPSQANNGSANSDYSGGISTVSRGSIGYSNDLSKRLKLNSSYSFNINNTNSLTDSYSENLTSLGLIFANNESNNDFNTKRHVLSFDLELEIDSANYLRIQPYINYSSTYSSNNSKYEQTGILQQTNIGVNNSKNTNPNLGGTLLYQHFFKKPGRNFSLNLSFNQNNQGKETEQDINILYYDNQTNALIRDSLVHLLVQRENLNNTFRQSMTFSERLNSKSRIDFNAQINRRSYNNSAYTDKITNNANSRIDSLTNVYEYSFTETRLSLNYRRSNGKYDFSFGITGIPTFLKGSSEFLNTSTQRSNFFLVPIARFEYQFSRMHRFSFNYHGNATEPTFDQIQPVRDVSNANNPVVGNPDLKSSFNHTLSFAYNNYIANSRLNYSINGNLRIVDDAVISSISQVPDQYGSFINETSFLNMDGVSTITANYSISKSLADRKYSLRLNGSVIKRDGVTVSNDLINYNKSWTFNQRFGPQINPNEWLELNLNINYIYSKADYTLSDNDNSTKTLALNTDGKIYIKHSTIFSFSFSQNFVSGVNSNVSNNPLIINLALEKQFLKSKNATLSLKAFDILQQNNFVNRVYTDQGFTDTKTNALSRYFMLSFRWILQKWSGEPSKNGKPMIRKGDGSFFID